jgi:hypothetical protein
MVTLQNQRTWELGALGASGNEGEGGIKKEKSAWKVYLDS